MAEFDFKTLIGRKLSVSMKGKEGMFETYVGKLAEVYDDFIKVEVNGFQRKDLEIVFIRKDQVRSFWVYY